MDYKLVLIIVVQIKSIFAAPMQLLLQPLQNQIYQQPLQRQLIAMQEMQALQNMYPMNSPMMMDMTQSMPILLLPDAPIISNSETNFKNNENVFKDNNLKHGNAGVVDEDLNSVVIDAEHNAMDSQTQRAVLLVPFGQRFSIGGIISAIPFLPIEVNVPDTISWAWNGISGIISGIGQRFKPKPPQEPTQPSNDMQNGNVKLFLKHLQNNKQNSMMPVMVMPIAAPMLPIQL